MGYGFGSGRHCKGGFDESILIWVLVFLLLSGDGGFGDFGKGCFGKGDDNSILIIIIALLLLSGGGGFLGLGAPSEE